MRNAPANNTPNPALLFIPDISGFTQFVAEVEIQHAQHIIEELLEILLDANSIDLKVSEIEGDAILFYRFGEAPTAVELLMQVQMMFMKFHTHLKKYHTHRVCNCGACKTAHQLTLKFVAHYGEISLNTVKQYQKLFGKEVIVAHRLMKNGIEHHEYALFTHNLIQACPQWVEVETAAWSPINHGGEAYDSGLINYCYLPLAPLLERVPELTPEDYSLPGVKAKVLETSITIDAPLEMVFGVISDLPWRSKWIPGSLPEVEEINSTLTQTGQTHRCLANGPVVVAHGFTSQESVITFTETDQQRSYCVIYTLTASNPTQTHLQASSFIRKNVIKETLFKLFMKKKMAAVYNQAWQNLKGYCEGLRQNNEDHPYQIVLERHGAQVA